MSKNKNMSRIEKLTLDITKARERIAVEEALIVDLQQQLSEVEDMEIIRLVRSQSLSPAALHRMFGESPLQHTGSPSRKPSSTITDIRSE